jgi:GH24 family phage-related lysozyme (muramidase)
MDPLEGLRARLRVEEGNVPWLYLDSLGLVTVGVGHLVTSVASAAMLPFALPSGGAAGAAAICREYDQVQVLEAGQLTGYYALRTTLRLSQAAIDGLLDADLASLALALEHRLRGFVGYPAPAREALLDMGFQLGPSGLLDKFPRMCAAAANGEWAVCAEECHSLGISEARNQARVALFQQAAGIST